MAQTLWGLYPVAARYLQTVSNLPSMAMVAVAYIPLMLCFFFYALPRDWRLIGGSRQLWFFAAVTVLRSITNVLAARYTLAIYVQMITMLTPFIVAAITLFVMRQQPPAGTLPAMALSFVGSAMMLTGQVGDSFGIALTPSDWLGIGLALISAVCLAVYMLAVGRTVNLPITGLRLLYFQSAAVGLSSLALSLVLGEDWGRFEQIGPTDWAMLVTFGVIILGGANGLQISSIRKVGAAVVSSLMGWRLFITFVASAIILHESLSAPLQIVGMLLVLGTVTWYLWKRP